MFHEVNFFHLVLLTSVERGFFFFFESLLLRTKPLQLTERCLIHSNVQQCILFGGELLVPLLVFSCQAVLEET